MNETLKTALTSIFTQIILRIAALAGIGAAVASKDLWLQSIGVVATVLASLAAEWIGKLQKTDAVSVRTQALIGEVMPSMERAIQSKEAVIKNPKLENPAPIVTPENVPSVDEVNAQS